MADEGMLKMTREELSEWNQREFLRYLFTGKLSEGLRIVENNTMRWRYAHDQKEFEGRLRAKQE